MTNNLKRLFIAVEPGVEVVEKLVLVQEDLGPILAARGAKARWVEASNIHITLKVIGEVDSGMISVISSHLAQVARKHAPFRINTEGIGAYPDGDKPRILYSGLSMGLEQLETLSNDMEVTLEKLGIGRDTREFMPHIMLGRIKTSKTRINLSDVISALQNINFGYSLIYDIILFESYLGPQGAKYQVIKRMPLTAE